MFYYIRYLILLVFLCFCSKKSNVPEWYKNPTINNNVFYGIGFSTVSYEDAKRKALIDITGQIKTTLQATTISNVSKIQNNVQSNISKHFSQTAIATVDNLEINNYNIEKQFSSEDDFYILISLNKSTFIQFLNNEILFKMNTLKDTLSELNGQNAVQKLLKLKDMNILLNSIKEKNFILRIIDKEYKANYDASILDLEKQINNIKQNISFFIEANNTKVKNIFQRILNKNSFKIKSSFDNQDTNLIKLNIVANEKELTIFDSKMLQIQLNCTFELENISFLSFKIEESASSATNIEQARDNLSLKLSNRVESDIFNGVL